MVLRVQIYSAFCIPSYAVYVMCLISMEQRKNDKSTFHSGLCHNEHACCPAVCHTNACAKIWINSTPLPLLYNIRGQYKASITFVRAGKCSQGSLFRNASRVRKVKNAHLLFYSTLARSKESDFFSQLLCHTWRMSLKLPGSARRLRLLLGATALLFVSVLTIMITDKTENKKYPTHNMF